MIVKSVEEMRLAWMDETRNIIVKSVAEMRVAWMDETRKCKI
jgi:hypothetical protein